MKYFLIRMSLIINFFLFVGLITIDIDSIPFKYWAIFSAIVLGISFINHYVMKNMFTKDERDKIFFVKKQIYIN